MRTGRRGAGLTRAVARGLIGAAPSSAAHRHHLERRVRAALSRVQVVERRERALPRSHAAREFLAAGRAVVARDLDHSTSELVPPSLRGRLEEGSDDVRLVSAPVAADVLAVAKFDLGQQLKLRAHYVGPRLTLALAPPGRAHRDPVLNSVRAHEVVSRHAPRLVPSLVAHGRVGRQARYLVEEWVDGTPVLTSARLAGAAGQILEDLARVHHGHGVRSMGLRERWGERLVQRWEETCASGVVPAGVGQRIAALMAQDRSLRISWTHGDLVASNVPRTTDGSVVLVDWEHSGVDVLMRDAAKLHLFSGRAEETLDQVLELLAHEPAPGAYTAAEELALAHAHLLSGYPARSAALQGHPRATVYERQVLRQVERLERVLDRC